MTIPNRANAFMPDNPTVILKREDRLSRPLQPSDQFTTSETGPQIISALTGSLALPFFIVGRALNVLTRGRLSSIKAPRALVWSLAAYNRRVLNPFMKRLKEDDTTAVVAFIWLLAVIIGGYVVARLLLSYLS